jgi:hypothetical protein
MDVVLAAEVTLIFGTGDVHVEIETWTVMDPGTADTGTLTAMEHGVAGARLTATEHGVVVARSIAMEHGVVVATLTATDHGAGVARLTATEGGVAVTDRQEWQ